jgi:hypothetical protein
MSQIFVSYSRQDTQFVDRFIESLVQMGYDIWMDRQNIGGGALWQNAISDGLFNSQIYVIILSPNSVSSNAVLAELNAAVEYKKTILPIRFQRFEFPPSLQWLAQRNWIDFHEQGFQNGLMKLTQAFATYGTIPQRAPQRRPDPPPPTLEQVVRMGGMWHV